MSRQSVIIAIISFAAIIRFILLLDPSLIYPDYGSPAEKTKAVRNYFDWINRYSSYTFYYVHENLEFVPSSPSIPTPKTIVIVDSYDNRRVLYSSDIHSDSNFAKLQIIEMRSNPESRSRYWSYDIDDIVRITNGIRYVLGEWWTIPFLNMLMCEVLFIKNGVLVVWGVLLFLALICLPFVYFQIRGLIVFVCISFFVTSIAFALAGIATHTLLAIPMYLTFSTFTAFVIFGLFYFFSHMISFGKVNEFHEGWTSYRDARIWGNSEKNYDAYHS